MKVPAPAVTREPTSVVEPERPRSSRGGGPASLQKTIATLAGSPHVRQLARQRVLINEGRGLTIQRRLLNARVVRAVPRYGQPDDAAVLQAKFEDGTYAGSASKGYVLIVGKAAGEYLLLKSGTLQPQVIPKGGREYQHLMRAPGMSAYTVADAPGQVYSVRTFGDIPSRIFVLENQLQDIPHVTWAMRQANDNVPTASAIVAFLTTLPEGPVLELAKAQVHDARNDVPVARIRTTFLSDYLEADKPIYELAVQQLRDAKDDAALAKKRTDFLSPYVLQEKAIFDLAKDRLQRCADDVVRADGQMKYLLKHRQAGKETFDIALHELDRASGDPDTAELKMRSLSGLFSWAGKAAHEEGEAYLQSSRAAAEDAETTSRSQAAVTAGISKTALSKGKIPKTPKGQTYRVALAAAAETKRQALEAAEVRSEGVEAEARARNIGFVGSVSAGALATTTLEWLMKSTGDDRKVVAALQSMMELQPDPNDRAAAELALKDGAAAADTAGICRELLGKGILPKSAIHAARFCARVSDANARTWVRAKAETLSFGDLDEHIRYLDEGARIGNALLVLQRCGLDREIFEIQPLLIQPAVRITWLLTHFGQPYFSAMITFLRLGQEKIEALENLVAFNVGNQNFGMADLVKMAGTYTAKKLLTVLQETIFLQGAEVDPTFIRLYIGWGANAGSSLQFVYLIRFQALLETVPATALTVYQADVNYDSSQDPPSRTGFLEYFFGNGDRIVIHTHWNRHAKKLVSIHVKLANQNGVEVNTWPHFKLVTEAVRDAHNAAAGGVAPTTTPLGGQLTL